VLDWVTIDGSPDLGDIPPGGNKNFVLRFAPNALMGSGGYARNPLLTIDSANLASMPINAAITVTDSQNGGIAFSLLNADKFPTDPTRFIAGAYVRLSSMDIGSLNATTQSDANGTAQFAQLPAGRYAYTIQSSGFQQISGELIIEPGLQKTLEVNLPTTMVSFTWTVTPTTIQDNYDMTLHMTYKTDVPAPVVVVTPPVVSLKMAGGQTADVQFAVTNLGVVSAFDVKLPKPDSDPAVQIDMPFDTIPELKAGQSVTIPAKITLVHASCHEIVQNLTYAYFCAKGVWTPTLVTAISYILGDDCKAGDFGKGDPKRQPPSNGTGQSEYPKWPWYGAPKQAFLIGSIVNESCISMCADKCHAWDPTLMQCVQISNDCE